MRLVALKHILKIVFSYLFGKKYFIYRFYNKSSKSYANKENLEFPHKDKIAIVIQGGILEEDNFTFSTITHYISHFPDILVVLSTWTLSKKLLDRLEKLKVTVVQNKMPKNRGIANIN